MSQLGQPGKKQKRQIHLSLPSCSIQACKQLRGFHPHGRRPGLGRIPPLKCQSLLEISSSAIRKRHLKNQVGRRNKIVKKKKK
jgi:hypothetical protein